MKRLFHKGKYRVTGVGPGILGRFYGMEREIALFVMARMGAGKNGISYLAETIKLILQEGKLKRASIIVQELGLRNMPLSVALLNEVVFHDEKHKSGIATSIITQVYRENAGLADELILKVYQDDSKRAISLIGGKSRIANVDKAQRYIVESFCRRFPTLEVFKELLPSIAQINLELAEEVACRLSMDSNYSLYVLRKECGDMFMSFEKIKYGAEVVNREMELVRRLAQAEVGTKDYFYVRDELAQLLRSKRKNNS
jgi:hypothetical protein